MQNNDKIKHIAELYFENNVSDTGVQNLLTFLTQDEASKTKIKKWEDEWYKQHVPSQDTIKAWDSFQDKLRANTAQIELSKPSPSHPFLLWHYIAVAAVVVIAIFGAAIWINHSNAEKTFIAYTTPNGTTRKINLSDGTKVWLNAGSQLTCSPHFNKEDRNVNLSGEAYFEVAHKDGLPFTVATSHYAVTVRGTKFNISAYADDPTVVTTLFEGKIDITSEDGTTKMVPGEKVSYVKSTHTLNKSHCGKEEWNWRTGVVACKKAKLQQFAKILERHYGVSVTIKNAQVANMEISVILQNGEGINDIVSALSHITGHKTTRNGRRILIE